ncbi:class I tRNA ligase family protein, partial [Staphylococcus aureus]
EGLRKAVKKEFINIINKGMIYRCESIIKYEPIARTALYDIEEMQVDVQGTFYHIKYPYADGESFIEIETASPETILGNTASVVN